MTNSEKIKLISDTYGYDAQSRQLIEEMAELTQAINKFWRECLLCGIYDLADLSENSVINTARREHIIEEIADVSIVLKQVEYMLKAEKEVEDFIAIKLDRQIDRIRSLKNNG